MILIMAMEAMIIEQWSLIKARDMNNEHIWSQDKESLGHKQLLTRIMMIMTWVIIMMM